jgi:tetratricopeptide (TPR) repeat protein
MSKAPQRPKNKIRESIGQSIQKPFNQTTDGPSLWPVLKTGLNKHSYLLICLLLILVTFAAFSQVLSYGFIDYDDNDYVTENPHVKAGLTKDSTVWAFTAGHSGNWHPLTWMSHMLDCQLFGTEAGWHHLTSLVIHIINTVLLFAVLKKMTRSLWPSAFVAAAFAIHPLHVESVAWIAERKDVLSSLFWILTMAAYLRYAKRPDKVNYLLTLVTFIFGLMAKPMLVTLPFVFLLLDFWPLERFSRRNFRRLVIEKIPFFVLSAISSVVTFLVQQRTGAVVRIEQIPLDSRVANAFISYLLYIAKMIWPSRLAVFYPYPSGKPSIWLALSAALLLLGISICVIRLAPNRRYLLTGWFWYLGTLVPVIGLVQVGTQAMADRYTYLPSIGIFIMTAWGIAELSAKWRYRKIALPISATLVIAAMLVCTRQQVRYWQNSFALFSRAVAVTKNNYIGHSGLGKALRAQGKLDEAIKQYHLALDVNQRYGVAHYNLANALVDKGKFNEAISHYNQALHINPNYAEAHNNLGYALATQGKLDEAIACFRQALQLRADDASTHYNLGYALQLKGLLDEAINHYRRALQINPDYPKAAKGLEAALAEQKNHK